MARVRRRMLLVLGLVCVFLVGKPAIAQDANELPLPALDDTQREAATADPNVDGAEEDREKRKRKIRKRARGKRHKAGDVRQRAKPTLLDNGLPAAITLMAATAGAGLAGLVAGALCGALVGAAAAATAAGFVRFGRLPPQASTIGIGAFYVAPPLLVLAGAIGGYALARATAAAATPLPKLKDGRPAARRPILATTFVVADAVVHAIAWIPVVVVAGAAGAATLPFTGFGWGLTGWLSTRAVVFTAYALAALAVLAPLASIPGLFAPPAAALVLAGGGAE